MNTRSHCRTSPPIGIGGQPMPGGITTNSLWLRGIAAKCRLPYSQRELLDLARRYDARADRLSRRATDR
jgi:hypothetical protein